MSVEGTLTVQDLRSAWRRTRRILAEPEGLRRPTRHARHVVCTCALGEVTMWHRFGLVFLACAIVGCGGETEPRTDGGAGTAGTAGSAGSGGSPGTGGSAGTGGGGTCATACGEARNCCGDHCVNLMNDPMNCGQCGRTCGEGTYCTGGNCVTPPCDTTCTGSVCCGSQCCSAGQLCCDPQGPLDMGPVCIEPNEEGTCPMGCAPLCICASPTTPIATPDGDKPIASLRVGDVVYSVDGGMVKAVPIARTNRTPVSEHSVVHLELASGAVLEISALHPTADGRRFADLRAGASLDGVVITRARVIPYAFDATYDILPDSDTGAYFAGGVLVGSTLAPSVKRVLTPTAPYSANSIAP